jgi:hypothetical protein
VILDQQDVDVFIGLDVGKSDHHAVALDRSGKRLHDRALPNDEARLREILTDLGRHGKVLLVVDQPATIGALLVVDQPATIGALPVAEIRPSPRLPWTWTSQA